MCISPVEGYKLKKYINYIYIKREKYEFIKVSRMTRKV